jgi:hypothetical protein
VTESEALRIMQQLAARYALQPLGEGEFTVQMFADANRMKYNAAKDALDRAIAAGEVEYVGERVRGGHTSHAYRVVNNPK